ncbi:MAG TPA: fluoride efflux transporter CrcB [Lentimicrobium sp.]|nr:fluoride efflux transporter CrcB [Lentimicrobium sp.]
MVNNILLIGLGGMIGAISRYLIYTLTDGLYHKQAFPFGTLLVNLIGSLIIGILLALAVKYTFLARHHASHYLLITGFLGAFTTFSTFSQDNMFLLFDKHYGAFALNILLNVGLGLVLTICGFVITKKLI